MSVLGLAFRLQVHQSEADATYLLAGTLLVTYVFHSAIRLVHVSFSKR